MPAEPEPVTVSEVVHRAAVVVDPAGEHPDVADVLAGFEDRDEPVSGVLNLGDELAEAVGKLDPEGEDPVLQMVWAVATYLAHRRDELAGEREGVLRLAARSEWDGSPPDHVVEWLGAQGVSV
jgi:hypothetical protein